MPYSTRPAADANRVRVLLVPFRETAELKRVVYEPESGTYMPEASTAIGSVDGYGFIGEPVVGIVSMGCPHSSDQQL
jgi:hypothetical protein